MDKYIPPYSITETMLRLVSEISEKIGRITGHNENMAEVHLRRNNRIRSIHSSLKIEANSLSISDVRDVLDGHLVMGDCKEIQEVKNAYAAYERIPEIDPFSVDDLKKLHGIITYGTADESGKFRKGNEGVFSGDRCVFIAPPPELVPGLVNDLLSWMKKNIGIVHPLLMSAVFHYEFVFIHPFSDGNGRMARLWHTVILSKWKKEFEYIPLESQIEKYQQEYYDAIEKCHSNGNSDVFIEFMLDMINKSLDDIIEQSMNNISVSKYVKRLLNCMEYDVPYTSSQLPYPNIT
ncbi:MAG: Fic family protein [Erysipelotrichaceae bacterium]|nr:Fic family protein [Erysipelotrichaceae bacterium]